LVDCFSENRYPNVSNRKQIKKASPNRSEMPYLTIFLTQTPDLTKK